MNVSNNWISLLLILLPATTLAQNGKNYKITLEAHNKKPYILGILLGIVNYDGLKVVDVSQNNPDCFVSAGLGPDSGRVATFANGAVQVCGGSLSSLCYAYDSANDEWTLQDFELLHGESGIVESAAGALMSDGATWLVSGGKVETPFRYDGIF